MYKNLILPASLLAATIIGAGIFALPYVFHKAGLITGLFYLITFTAVFIIIHLMYADVSLRTPGIHRFVGYAEIYLGSAGKWLTILAAVIGMALILTVYLILSVSFLNLFTPSAPDVQKLLLFWFLSSITIFWGINRLAISEFLITFGIAAIILVIFVLGFGNFARFLSEPIFNLNYVFLPYGPVLFALAGRTAVLAVVDYLRRNNQSLSSVKKPIIWGTLLPAVIYSVFVVSIINLSGKISEDSVSGLLGRLPPPLLWLLGILGIGAIWSTYIVIGRDIRKILETDLKLPDLTSRILVFLAPLGLYFAGLKNFLPLVALTGGVFVGLESILVILIWQKLSKQKGESIIFKKLNPAIPYLLLLIFVFGIILAIIPS